MFSVSIDFKHSKKISKTIQYMKFFYFSNKMSKYLIYLIQDTNSVFQTHLVLEMLTHLKSPNQSSHSKFFISGEINMFYSNIGPFYCECHLPKICPF